MPRKKGTSASRKRVKQQVKAVPKKPKVSSEEKIPKPKDRGKEITLLRGMKDILPHQSEIWQTVRHAAEHIAEAYGFNYMETPVLEQASLFIRSLGRGTDVVEKEMYVFEDTDGGRVCLRPENTAAIARAYINHGLQTLPQPVKAWYFGPMFRHDRPQAGRFREFHQFGAETMGERHPVVDAELIALCYNFLRDLGIAGEVHVNSIGTPQDRAQYVVELTGYLKSKRSYLSEDSKRRLIRNPLRILDSKDEQDRIVIEEAPQIIDWLSPESKKFFEGVLEYLDELDIPYVLTPTLVRGLDYYTDTVFELYEEGVAEASQNALGGGGRYDGLIPYLGGLPTPGSGMSMGIERIITVLHQKAQQAREEGKEEQKKKGGIFFAQLGEQGRKRSLALMEELRRGGVTVFHNFAKASLKAQLEVANKLGVGHTLILGQKEVQDGTVLIRNMDSGIQEVVDQKKLKAAILKLTGKA